MILETIQKLLYNHGPTHPFIGCWYLTNSLDFLYFGTKKLPVKMVISVDFRSSLAMAANLEPSQMKNFYTSLQVQVCFKVTFFQSSHLGPKVRLVCQGKYCNLCRIAALKKTE